MKRTITEYVDALTAAAATIEDPEIVRLCDKAAKQQKAIADETGPRGIRFQEFLRVHDAFARAVGDAAGIEFDQAPNATLFRRRVQETFGLPDPMEFKLKEERRLEQRLKSH